MHKYAGLVELSPSPVPLVCQEGGQVELTCNTTSGTAIDHRWEFTLLPENETYTTPPVTSLGMSGVPRPQNIGTYTVTFSRLSGPNVLSLVSMVTINPTQRK